MKKQKSPYPQSFSKRLTWRIILTMLVVMGLFSVPVFFGGYSSVDVGLRLVANRYLSAKNEMVSGLLSDVRVAAVNTLPQIEESLDNPEKLSAIVERMVRLNPRIHSCGISFVADYYPQRGRWYCPYAYRTRSDSIVTLTVGDAQHDYLSDEWFTEAVAAVEGYWGKPFFDTNDADTPMVPWLMPVRDRHGTTVAVLGVDMSLDWLSEKVEGNMFKQDTIPDEEWDPEHQNYLFIVDGDGRYIVHPDRRRVISQNFRTVVEATPDTVDNYLCRQMLAGEDGHYDNDDEDEKLIIDGEEVFVSYVPINDINWSLAWVVPQIYIDFLGNIVGGIFIFFIVMGLLVTFLVTRRFIKRATKPIRQLATSANEVAKGHFDTQLPDIKRKDEIRLLRDSFEGMQHSLAAYIDELKSTTASKAAIENELRIAHNIQMSMLPKTFPPFPNRHDIDVYGTLTPAREVGGDLFDFFIRDDQLFFCVGDVSGKGVPASLVMAVARSLFRNVSAHEPLPHHIVMALNGALSENNDTNMFVTLFAGVLHLATGHLTYCNAGHDAPLVIGRQVDWLPCDPNLPIGVMPGWQFSLQETTLPPHSTLFVFTDGLNEAEDVTHAQFGDERILRLARLLQANDVHAPQAIIRQMTQAVCDFVGDAEQSDDLTMLAIQYVGSEFRDHSS